jgi:predicted GNAT family N-acyltransferase
MSFDPRQTPSVRLADWEADQEALRAIRTRVFVEEQGVPAELEWDGADTHARHLLATSPTGAAMGTARVLPNGQIGRMAVLPDWRRRGVGSTLLGEALALALEPGLPRPFVHAQISVLAFYARHGFVAEGKEFFEAGIPHRLMRYPGAVARPNDPDQLDLDALKSGEVILEGRARIQAMSLHLADQARREILILSQDLDPDYYDRAAFIAAMRRLALAAPGLPIRILVREPRVAITRGHRLLGLARQLTSSLSIRRPGKDSRDRPDAFLIADGTGYCRRPLAGLHEAVACLDGRRQARLLRADFEKLWERADEDTELRRLYL